MLALSTHAARYRGMRKKPHQVSREGIFRAKVRLMRFYVVT